MNGFLNWLLSTLTNGASAGVLLAIVGYLGRAHLAQWFAKDLLQQRIRHEAELQEKKLLHERELESYRTSLIAAAEATKATQDVKKSLALLVVEKEFAALDELHKASLGNAVYFISCCEVSPVLAGRIQEMSVRIDRLDSAVNAISIFLGEQSKLSLLHQYSRCLIEVYANNKKFREDIESSEWKSTKIKLYKAEIAVDKLITDEVIRLRSMA